MNTQLATNEISHRPKLLPSHHHGPIRLRVYPVRIRTELGAITILGGGLGVEFRSHIHDWEHMKERPILFSTPMVNAILAGRKTQTRRIVKPSKWEHENPEYGVSFGKCHFGKVGDILWVKETWQYADWTDDGYPWIRYTADDSIILRDVIPDSWGDRLSDIWAALSASENYDIDGRAADRKWRPSMFMPRWASRITLEITGISVERLNDITPADCVAEGYKSDLSKHYAQEELNALDWYRDLWEQLNGEGSWALNPWVWVIEFRRV